MLGRLSNRTATAAGGATAAAATFVISSSGHHHHQLWFTRHLLAIQQRQHHHRNNHHHHDHHNHHNRRHQRRSDGDHHHHHTSFARTTFHAAGLFGITTTAATIIAKNANTDNNHSAVQPSATTTIPPTQQHTTTTTTALPNAPPNMTAALQDVLAAADQHFDENQYQEALDVLNKHTDQSLADIKWRQARAMFKLSREDGAAKADLIRGAYTLAAEAVALDEANYSCHKWMAILLDGKGELDGIKERVKQLDTVKQHMLRAVELNPDDPTGLHLLGNFAFGLADISWYQRKIVTALFATPPTGTYEEALGYFLAAEEKKANFYSINLLLIGKCYAALKDTPKAKEYLQRAANVKALNADDKRCKEEATALLKKY